MIIATEYKTCKHCDDLLDDSNASEFDPFVCAFCEHMMAEAMEIQFNINKEQGVSRNYRSTALK